MSIQRLVFWLRQATLIGLCLPVLYLAWRWYADELGARPVTQATHITGDWAVVFLLCSLALTPARSVFDWMPLMQIRRRVGVATALYALLHLLIYVADQKWSLVVVALEIAKRFYLTIGFVAVLALVVLAVTSTDGWQKRLRLNWKRLHWLVYPAAVLAILHFFIQSKANVGEATVAAGLFAWLMIWRFLPSKLARSYPGLALLAVAATLSALAFEIAWYGLVNNVDPLRILRADIDPDLAPRPTLKVLLSGLAVLALVGLRRGLRAWQSRRKVAAMAGCLLCLGVMIGQDCESAAQELTVTQVVRLYDATVTYPGPMWAATEAERLDAGTSHRQEEKDQIIIEEIRKSETLRNWTQMLKVVGSRLPDAQQMAVHEALDLSLASHLAACDDDDFAVEIFEEHETSVTFVVACGNTPNAPQELGYGDGIGEISVGRLFLVKDTMIQIQYSWRGPEFDYKDPASFPVPLAMVVQAAERLEAAAQATAQ